MDIFVIVFGIVLICAGGYLVHESVACKYKDRDIGTVLFFRGFLSIMGFAAILYGLWILFNSGLTVAV